MTAIPWATIETISPDGAAVAPAEPDGAADPEANSSAQQSGNGVEPGSGL